MHRRSADSVWLLEYGLMRSATVGEAGGAVNGDFQAGVGGATMRVMRPQERAEVVERLARETGFDAVGIVEAGPVARGGYYLDWLRKARHGEMDYLARSAEVRLDSRRLLAGGRSVIVVAESYKPAAEDRPVADRPADERADEPRGRIARYAWGRDYHRVLRRKLHRLADGLRAVIGEPFEARVCVDSGPVLERELAAAAGVGWIGKNTLVLRPTLGSYFFLGELVTTLEIAPSEPMADHCGSCTQCIEACPTRALIAPYQMDASRCIAYLTIEHRGEIDEGLRPAMGDWIFGCDVCQEVCPHNRKAAATREPGYSLSERFPLAPRPALETVLKMTEEQRGRWLSGSAMKRAGLEMLKRNAAIALENARPGIQDGLEAGAT